MNGSPKICPECARPLNARGDGDMAAYLLQDNYCQCHSRATPRKKNSFERLAQLSRAFYRGKNNSARPIMDACPKCGLERQKSRAGSITGYLFQDLRCHCIDDPMFAPGVMTGKFFNLQKAGLGTTFAAVNSPVRQQKHMIINLAGGAIIGGVYKIKHSLGQGGMGEVYLAEHTGLRKICALKVIPPDQVTEIGWKRFQQEAKAVAALNHINIVRVSDLGIHEGCLPFYAMEYVEGKSLADMLAEHGTMPLAQAIEIFKQIGDGVDYAHRAGIIHRDLKPANIMVARDGNKWQVKILDFGLAKLARQDREKQGLTSVGEIFGSPFYMSPEQCLGQKVDNRSDIYSIGCTLFECLTGQPPFIGHLPQAIMFSHETADPPALNSVKTIRDIKATVPESMEIVMAKLLRKNPVERYQTCAELRTDLVKVERNESVEPFYVSRTKVSDSLTAAPYEEKVFDTLDLSPKPRPNKLIFISGIAGVVALACAAAFFAKNLEEKKAPAPIKGSAAIAAKTLTTPGEIIEFRDDIQTMEKKPPHQSATITTPYSTIINRGNKKFLRYAFPTDVMIGEISYGNQQTWYKAQGTVEIPQGQDIVFRPWKKILDSPNYIKRFRKGDFQQLAIFQLGDPNAMVVALTDLPFFKDIQDFSLIAKPRNKFQDGDSQPKMLNAASLAIIGKCDVQRLNVSDTVVSMPDLVNLPFLKQLHGLGLYGYNNVDPVCEALAGSAKLNELHLPCQVSAKAWAAICTMSKLRQIVSPDGLQTHEQLRELTKVKTLQGFSLGHLSIDSETVELLKNFKDLHEIYLAKRGYADRAIDARLKAELSPTLRVAFD